MTTPTDPLYVKQTHIKRYTILIQTPTGWIFIKNWCLISGNFIKNWYLSIFWKAVENTQVSLKSDKNNGYFTRRPVYIFFITSRSFLLMMRNSSDKIREKIKTYILCTIEFFRKSCRLWDNVEEYGTDGQATNDKKILRFWSACWVTNTLVAFPRQWWKGEAQQYAHFPSVVLVVGLRINVLWWKNFAIQ